MIPSEEEVSRMTGQREQDGKGAQAHILLMQIVAPVKESSEVKGYLMLGCTNTRVNMNIHTRAVSQKDGKSAATQK